MKAAEFKACRDCKYYRVQRTRLQDKHWCDNPRFQLKDYDFITGTVKLTSLPCIKMRQDPYYCGHSASRFQLKES